MGRQGSRIGKNRSVSFTVQHKVQDIKLLPRAIHWIKWGNFTPEQHSKGQSKVINPTAKTMKPKEKKAGYGQEKEMCTCYPVHFCSACGACLLQTLSRCAWDSPRTHGRTRCHFCALASGTNKSKASQVGKARKARPRGVYSISLEYFQHFSKLVVILAPCVFPVKESFPNI